MNQLLAAIPAYAPALVYLLAVCAALAATGSCPTWVHPAALVVGAPARVLTSGWTEAAASFSLAAVLFFLLVYFAGRSVSGVTLFSLVAAIALTPTQGWPALVAALIVVTGVAVHRTLRGHGKSRVAWIVMDSMEGMGLRPGRGIGVPNADLVPTKDTFAASASTATSTATSATTTTESSEDTDSSTSPDRTMGKPIYLPPYLLGGVSAALAAAVLLGG